ncbi:hypothetical protein H5410_001195 [Solanum commersonii]|uniref:DUF4283 domain-containing protein n=1 Tax=Solanum commersonii TaxID=4109 RepID=A0A9J6AY86_SOLCO|nr:hypothetical protein H5410_001195 [Solanum commersonii]
MAASPSPQPMVVGETNVNINTKAPYVAILKPQQTIQNLLKTVLKPIEFIHGEPVKFTMEEREQYAREEGLYQVVIIKVAYGKPVLSELRKLLPKQFDVKGNCNIRQLDFRHLLIRIFPWTPSFNPKEETPKAWVWISLPKLPTDLFARRSLLSVATAAGKPIVVDKATQDRTRPSTARVKIILDLLDKHPNRVRLLVLEKESGKIIEHYQKIVYDNLPLYCTHCKHQGHEENECRLLMRKTVSQGDRLGDEVGRDITLMQPDSEANNTEQLKGDARDFLNDKKVGQKDIEKAVGDQNIGQRLAEKSNSNKDNSLAIYAGVTELNVSIVPTTENQILVPSREIVQHQMDILGDRNNQQDVVIGDIVDHVRVKEHNSATVTKTLVTVSQVDSGQQLNGNGVENQSVTDARINIEITRASKPIDLQAENSTREENASRNWRVIAHKNSVVSHIGSSTSRSNSSSQEKGKTRRDKANLVDEKEQVSPPPLNRKLSPEAPIIMPKSVIAKKNESGALASGISQCIDLENEFFEEDEEDNMLDIYFDKVARDRDLSPRQQRSGSNKSKKKAHGRQHSWDGKVNEEFVPGHLPMRLAKQNHMTISTTLTRSTKSKKK